MHLENVEFVITHVGRVDLCPITIVKIYGGVFVVLCPKSSWVVVCEIPIKLSHE